MKNDKLGNSKHNHGPRYESTVKVLKSIIKGNNTWSKLNIALKEEMSFKMVSRNLYYAKYALIPNKIVRSENGKLKVNYSDFDSLLRLVELLIKDPDFYKLFTYWVHSAYESPYGDQGILLEPWMQDEDYNKWETVMKRSRGKYDLDFALSYLVLAIFHGFDIWDRMSKGEKELDQYVSYNMLLDTEDGIKRNSRNKAVKPILRYVYNKMIVEKKTDPEIDPLERSSENWPSSSSEESLDQDMEQWPKGSGGATYIRESMVGEIGYLINKIMLGDLEKVYRALPRMEKALEREGVKMHD